MVTHRLVGQPGELGHLGRYARPDVHWACYVTLHHGQTGAHEVVYMDEVTLGGTPYGQRVFPVGGALHDRRERVVERRAGAVAAKWPYDVNLGPARPQVPALPFTDQLDEAVVGIGVVD